MEESNELFNDIMKVYLAQMSSAIEISKIISEHGNHSEVTGDDIVCGLIYRLMTPMKQEEIDKSFENTENILDSESDEEQTDLDYDLIKEQYKKISETHKLKSNHCNCDTCIQMRVCLLNYHTFETTDQLSQIFKKAIEKACEEYKIYI